MQDIFAEGIGSSSEAWLSVGKFYVICYLKFLFTVSIFDYSWNLQVGFIGRLDYQKGIDLIRMAIPELMEDDVQFVSGFVN